MRTEPLMNRHSETSLLLQLARARISKHATQVLNRGLCEKNRTNQYRNTCL